MYKIDVSPKEQDERLLKKSLEAIRSQFPIEGNFYTLRVSNLRAERTSTDQDPNDAIFGGGSILNTVKGDIELLRNSDKRVIDTKRGAVIARIPAITDRGTFVVDGNPYVVPNQQRLKPGPYVVKRQTGDVGVIFNTDGNRQLKLTYDKERGLFNVRIGNTTIPAFSLLKALGGDISDMERVTGKQIAETNAKRSKPTDIDKFVSKSYATPKSVKDDANAKMRYLLETMSMDPGVSERNLGVKSDKLTREVFLTAIKKVFEAAKSSENVDQKINLANKKILTAAYTVPEQFIKMFKTERAKIEKKLGSPNVSKVRDVFSAQYATSAFKNYITASKLARMPEEYNPLQIHMASKLLTPLGESGIGTERALGEDDKAVHPSHIGFIDPIVSPEGAKTGITLAVTSNAYVSDNGEPAIKVLNTKTGKEEIVPIAQLWDKKLAIYKSDGKVVARHRDKQIDLARMRDADYALSNPAELHASSTHYLPLLNSMDANRATMAQKHTQQALPLEHREEPFVDTKLEEGTASEVLAHKTSQVVRSDVGGVVERIDEDGIVVGGKKIAVPKNVPLARKTYIDYHPVVKVGQKIKKGDIVAESSYTKNGKLSLGTHLRTAWLSMPGNRNDAVVVSETAAKKLTSAHMYKHIIAKDSEGVYSAKKAHVMFPGMFEGVDLGKYDERGFVKPGVVLKKGDPVAFHLTPNKDKPLTMLDRLLHKPYKLKVERWEHDHPGRVVSMSQKGDQVRVFAKTKAEARVGDKISGRYGNKGVISKILPDNKMPHNSKGEPVHVVFTSASVVSRTNPGQIIEAALGKVSRKTGKRYAIELYGLDDNRRFADSEAKKHGVELEEKLINPETGKPFPGKVFVGEPYTYKLFKDAESGMSAMSTDRVDLNQQPAKGGKNSSASIANMEVNALLAHGAKKFLKEARDIKGQRNDEWFEAYRKNLPLPKPAENYAYAKFKALLEQLGVDVEDTPSRFALSTMDSKAIKEKAPAVVKSYETIDASTGKPRKGGLFDTSIFGEFGNRYARIDLAAQVINPFYTEEIARVLGMTKSDLAKAMSDPKSEQEIIKAIKSVDVARKRDEFIAKAKETKNDQIADKYRKAAKFLDKLRSSGKTLEDVALQKHVLVIPPVYRPIVKDHTGKYGVSDINLHYQDIMAVNKALAEAKKNKLSDETVHDLRKELQNAISAMYGLSKSNNPRLQETKGILDILGGDTPKRSFVHKTLLRKNQFMSGRAVIVPPSGDLKLDEVELPTEMGLKMYEPHISRELAKGGYKPIEVKKMIEDRHPLVVETLHRLGREIPVAYNRAPSLWRHNIVGAFPRFTDSKTIRVPPMVERALGADYDGDQIAVHVPVTPEGIHDIKEKVLASRQLFTDQGPISDKDLLMIADQDVIIGINKASQRSKKKPIRVRSIGELKQKLIKGEISYNDPVVVE